MLVKENINFKRGIDPKEAMDVGLTPERMIIFLAETLQDIGFEPDIRKNVKNVDDYEKIMFLGNVRISLLDVRDEWTLTTSNSFKQLNTKNINKVTKEVINMYYKGVDNGIKQLEKQLEIAKKAKEFIENN